MRVKLRKVCAILTCLIMCLSTVIPTFALDGDTYIDDDGTVYDVTPFKVLNANDEEVKSKWLSGSSEFADQTWYHEMLGLAENSDFKIENTAPSVYTIKVKNFIGDEKQPIASETGENPKLRYNLDVFKASPEEVLKYVGKDNASKMDTTQSHAIVKVECTYDDGEYISNSCYNLLFTTGAIQSTADKSALNAAIAAAPNAKTDQTYYHTNDRYNGTDTSANGFWADMEAVVNAAKAVQADPLATQDEVDAAAASLKQDEPNSALKKAISKLIPSTQANTTKLYEALQGIRNLPTENTGYTAVSWDNYVTAKKTAQSLFAGLFKEKEGKRVATENNKAKKQGDIDNAATVLTAAKEDLLQSKGLEERIALWKEASTWLLAQNQQVQQGQYTEASAGAWNTAYASLQKAKQEGYQTQSRYDAYTSSVVALSTAYYDLQDSNTEDITVHVRVADNFGAMFPEYAIQDPATATFDQHVTLGQGNKTINALLHAMSYDDTPKTKTPSSGTQYGEGWKNPEVMVYINGTLAVNRSEYIDSWQGYIGKTEDGKLNTSKLYFDVQLHDKDEIVILRALGPGYNYYGDIAAGVAQYNFYYGSLALLNIKENVIEVEAGKTFTVNVEKTTAAAEAKKATTSASDVSLFLSEKQETEDAAKAAPALEAVGSKTDANGKATTTLYKEGWYRLATVDVTPQTPTIGNNNGDESGGNFPNLAAGDYVLVHVTSSADTSAARASLQAELDQVYRTYAEGFYGTDADTVRTLYRNTSQTIANSTLLGEAYDAQEAAIAKLKQLQEEYGGHNDRVLEQMTWHLDNLPSVEEAAAGGFTQAYAQRFATLKNTYETATDYQRSLLNGQQSAQYEALKKLYGTDGAALPAQMAPHFRHRDLRPLRSP